MTARTLTLKPSPGLIVRDPKTGEPLPETGRDVPDNGYWQRRLRDGDVQLVTAPDKPNKPVKE